MTFVNGSAVEVFLEGFLVVVAVPVALVPVVVVLWLLRRHTNV